MKLFHEVGINLNFEQENSEKRIRKDIGFFKLVMRKLAIIE